MQNLMKPRKVKKNDSVKRKSHRQGQKHNFHKINKCREVTPSIYI